MCSGTHTQKNGKTVDIPLLLSWRDGVKGWLLEGCPAKQTAKGEFAEDKATQICTATIKIHDLRNCILSC